MRRLVLSISGLVLAMTVFTAIFAAPVRNNGPHGPDKVGPKIAVTAHADLVAAGASGIIVFSHDGGINWSQAKKGPSFGFFDLTDNGRGVLVDVGGGAIYRSVNAGNSWNKMVSTTSTDLWSIKYDAPTKKFVIVGGDHSGKPLLLYSTDNGIHWTKIEEDGYQRLTLATDKKGHLVMGGVGRLLKYSTAGGNTWNNATSPPPYHAESIRDIIYDGLRFLAVDDKGLFFHSTDGV